MEILCTSKIPTLYNIKSQVGENGKEHWYPDRKVQNKLKNLKAYGSKLLFPSRVKQNTSLLNGKKIKRRERKDKNVFPIFLRLVSNLAVIF